MKWVAMIASILGLSVLAGWLSQRSPRPDKTASTHGLAAVVSESTEPEVVLTNPQDMAPPRVDAQDLVEVPAVESHDIEQAREAKDTVKLFGVVRFSDGSPAEWANVNVPTQSGTYSTVCDWKGRYRIDSIERGLWRIGVSIDRLWRMRGTLDAKGTATEFEENFVLGTPPPFRILLLDRRGGPLTEHLIAQDMKLGMFDEQLIVSSRAPSTAEHEADGTLTEKFCEATTGLTAGHARASTGPPGTVCVLYLKEPLPAWFTVVANGRPLSTQYVTGVTREIVFTTSPEELVATSAAVRGRTTFAVSGRPIQAKVSIRRPGTTGQPQVYSTDADGHFHLELLRPGQVTLVTWLEGFAPSLVPIELKAGQTIDLQTLRMHEPVSISGWVDSSEQAKDHWYYINARGLAMPHYVLHGRDFPQDSGRFELTGLEPGEYTLQVESWTGNSLAHLSRVIVVDTTHGSIRGVRLALQKSTRVEIEFGSTEIARFATLVAKTQNGLVAASLPANRPTRSLELLPGTYTFELMHRGILKRSQEVTVGNEDQIMRFDLE